MKKYTAICGSGDAAENGIWTQDYKRQVLSARELHALGVELSEAIYHDWSDAAIDALVEAQ